MALRMTAALAAALIAVSAASPLVQAQPTPPPTPARPAAAADQPELSLPTPPGETWRVIQGYSCGTHDAPVDRYALDLIAADGRTLGAPVRAAAPGTIMAWVAPSGTLILDHGGGFFTQYTHMEPLLTERGTTVPRGAQIGTVGERATPGNPHLHFALYTQPPGFDAAARAARRALPLRFREGYDLPAGEGCSQHAGTELTAPGAPRPRVAARRSAPGVEPVTCPTRGLCMR